MAGNEVHNKNAAGGPPRLRPFWMEEHTGPDGAHAANAGDAFSSMWLNTPETANSDTSKIDPNKPAMSLWNQFPPGLSLHAKNPPVELDSTQARTGAPLQLFNDPEKVGKPGAYRATQGASGVSTFNLAQPQVAPAPQQSVAQTPVTQKSKSTIHPIGDMATSSAPDGSRAASAGEGLLAGIMKYLAPTAPTPRGQYVQPMPVATSRPYQDMDTDTMKEKATSIAQRLKLVPDQAIAGPSNFSPTQPLAPAMGGPRKSNYGERLVNNAITHYLLPNPPNPDDKFSAFIAQEEAKRAAVQSPSPNVAAAKNPNNAIDQSLVSQLETETANRENLHIPGNPNAPKSKEVDGPVVSAQTPDSYVMGPADGLDPDLMAKPAEGGDPALAEEGFTLDPNGIGLRPMGPEQAPIGEHPIDEEVMTGVLEGKTPTPETPEEESRIAYLQSQRGINADRELAGQDAMRAQIARLEGYSQMDYRPLAALVDTWTGSKMAPSFAGPIDREPLIAQLNAAIQKGDQHLSDADMQALKDYNDNQTRLAAAKGNGTGSDPMALLRERARLAAIQKRDDHAWQDKRDIKKGTDAQTRAETYAGAKKTEKEEKATLDADNRDTALSEKISDSFDSKGVGTISRLTSALVRYRNLLDGAGTSFTGGTFLAGTKQKEIDAAYADYTALAKDEKVLGQLTASDRQIIQDTVSSNTGLVALNDTFTGDGVKSIQKQIDGAIERLRVSARDKVSRLRSVAGKGKNPRTHVFIDTIESEIGQSTGMASDEALAISTLKEQTRALAAERAAKKKAESKGGTP